MKKLTLFLLLAFIAFGAFCRDDVRTFIPPKAFVYIPLLKQEQIKFWSGHPQPELLAGLAEQESCISLRHSRCWDPRSELKTQRELGSGIFQLTRAYTKSGSLRFDSLTAMQKQYPVLKELSWDNVYQRPDLQFRAAVLMSRDNYNALWAVVNTKARLGFADAAYNGGLSGVQNERRACGLKKGCDPQQWFGHVENVCLKSKAALYGNRSACDINREHVRNVMLVRSAKYANLMR